MIKNADAQIAEALEKIFSHRESHIVIGLTGRTGSGCTSVAELLATDTFSSITLPEISNSPYTQEARKATIIKKWLSEKWKKFLRISVSDIILLVALSENRSSPDSSFDIIKSSISNDLPDKLFSENFSKAQDAINVLKDLKQTQQNEINSTYAFIFDELPDIARDLRTSLNTNGKTPYTEVFQKIGDNIRKSGKGGSSEISPEALLVLPELISQILKLHRIKFPISDGGVHVVIDALRHPFEIRYLRERIARFYLIAVTTNDNDRKARLIAQNYNISDINSLDAKEYPSESIQKVSGYDALVSQNIQACLALADIYVSNLGQGRKDMKETAQQLMRYVALMQHPGIVNPTSVERCMQVAFSAKVNSGCISRQVGAVVTDTNFAVKSIGWNDVPKGQVPCLLRNAENVHLRHDEIAYSEFELENDDFRKIISEKVKMSKMTSLKGRNYCFCFKDIYNNLKSTNNQVHTRSLHAEENAFLQIAKNGGPAIEGGNLFSTASPCELCAKKAFQLGIKNIYYIDPYPGISVKHVLASGENRPEVILFSGAIGRAYHDLYDPILPFKDELSKMSVR
jgi:dCMP deaminase